jgi:hypothetical protein
LFFVGYANKSFNLKGSGGIGKYLSRYALILVCLENISIIMCGYSKAYN